MSDLLSVAVLGSTGYVGLQLVDLLSKHPKIILSGNVALSMALPKIKVST